jgi:acetyl esterase/lipase
MILAPFHRRNRAVVGLPLTLCLLSGLALPCAVKAEGTSRTVPQATKQAESIAVWPDKVPGEKGDIGPEADTTKPGQDGSDPKNYVIRTGNVSHPTLTVYHPPKDKDTGAAVLVCPGGGYSILALNLEGSEVCHWLNSIGVTAILLKYRVPARAGLEKHTAALQDAQRALSVIRHRAKEWGVDAKRLGILGFSAGGHLAAAASTNYETRTYPEIDAADKENCRPDFTILIYPAYLTDQADMSKLAPEIKVTAHTPPAFIAMTQDDPVHVENAFTYAKALQNAKVSVELHVYPTGGHGYGLRPSPNMVSHWPERAAEWLNARGWLRKDRRP